MKRKTLTERQLVILAGVLSLLALLSVAAVFFAGKLLRERQAQVAEAGIPPDRDALILYEPEESRSPVPAGQESGQILFCVSEEAAACYQLPDRSSPVLAWFQPGESVRVINRQGSFWLCKTGDGAQGYVDALCLGSSAEDYPYVEIPGALDLRLLIPDARFDLLFASPDNITGHALYPAIPIMEEHSAQLLAAAADRFRTEGYQIRICDAYRPKSAQFELYDMVQDSRFIADPYNTSSWHNVGRAVDMSLIDMRTGEELEMPTPMHTFDESAARYESGKWTEAARANVEYMTRVMIEAGFGTIPTEWWHFEYTGPGGYLSKNLQLDAEEYLR